MKNLLYSICIISLFSACKKEVETRTQVSGIITQNNSDVPVQGALVTLAWMETFTFNRLYHTIDSAYTDQQGHYSITTDVHTDQRLLVYAEAEQHYTNLSRGLQSNASRGRSQIVDIPLIPYAWVRVHFVPTEGHDYVLVNRPNGGNQEYQIWTDTVIVSQIYGNQEVDIPCFFIKNGVQVKNQQFPVMTIAPDTVDMEIPF